MKRALVTGVTGQDGAYLSDHLLNMGYEVFGAYRRTSSSDFWRLDALKLRSNSNFHLIELDITDTSNVLRVLASVRPAEVYNLAAQSFVAVSFEQPLATSDITGMAVAGILEAIRIVDPNIRFYQASTSEMFGYVQEVPQTEHTPFYPRSPYGVAKLFAHWMTINYRESHGIFATSGILFNHESPLRGPEFVTRKISLGVANIVLTDAPPLQLGNLDAKRDWGFAGDYVKGMHKMLQAEEPDTFVLATGRTETVRDFVIMSFGAAGVTLEFSGEGAEEKAFDAATGRVVVEVNSDFYRPAEVDLLLGDPSKARAQLGWESETDLETLCKMMVDSDLALLGR